MQTEGLGFSLAFLEGSWTKVWDDGTCMSATVEEVTMWRELNVQVDYYIQEVTPSAAQGMRVFINFFLDNEPYSQIQTLSDLCAWGGYDKSQLYSEQNRRMLSWEFSDEIAPAVKMLLHRWSSKYNWKKEDPRKVWP